MSYTWTFPCPRSKASRFWSPKKAYRASFCPPAELGLSPSPAGYQRSGALMGAIGAIGFIPDMGFIGFIGSMAQ